MRRPEVVVIGGGLAGLAAASELVDHDINVTLIEAGPSLGGKLSAWKDVDGDSVEHGIHTWWPNYVNFFEMMKRVGVASDALRPSTSVTGLFPDGTRFEFSSGASRRPATWTLVRSILRSPMRTAWDVLCLIPIGVSVLAFDQKRDFERYDSESFKAWLWRRGVTRRMYELFFEPYVRSFSFDSPEKVSAAVVLSSLHFYLLHHADDVYARYLRGSPAALILDPIAKSLTQRGCKIVTGVSVDALLLDEAAGIRGIRTSHEIPGRGSESVERSVLLTVRRTAGSVVGLAVFKAEHDVRVAIDARTPRIRAYRVETTDVAGDKASLQRAVDAGELTEVPVRATPTEVIVYRSVLETAVVERLRVLAAEVPETGFRRFGDRIPILLGRDPNVGFIALSPRCTHAGGPVAWQSDRQQLRCPYHGATFDRGGLPTGGPALQPLRRFSTRKDGDHVVVFEDEAAAPESVFDHYVLALDVSSAQRLLPERARRFQEIRDVDALTSTPVLVLRLWFDDDVDLEASDSGVFVQPALLDNYFVLSRLHDEFKASRGCVIEVQAYDVVDDIRRTDASLIQLATAEIRTAFPSITSAPRKAHVARHMDTFALHRVGHAGFRPSARTALSRLHLAGDWLRSNEVSWNMERAVVSGRLAAESVLRDVGGATSGLREYARGGVVYRAFVGLARLAAHTWGAVRRITRGDKRSKVPPEAPDADTASSLVVVRVVKFPGDAREAVVALNFQDLHGAVRVSGGRATATFRLNLLTFDSGVFLRNRNVSRIIFSRLLSAVVRVSAETQDWPTEATLRDAGSLVRFALRVELNGHAKTTELLAQVRYVGSSVTLYGRDELELEYADFGIDVTALESHSSVRIAPSFHVAVRVTVPDPSEGGNTHA